jgi:hypothetical protein
MGTTGPPLRCQLGGQNASHSKRLGEELLAARKVRHLNAVAFEAKAHD